MSTAVYSTGDKILNIMKETDMSIKGLAELSGVSENTLLNILAGIKGPDIGTACRIADTFGICVRELCPDEERYVVLVEKDTLAKLIVVSEINGVELDELNVGICLRDTLASSIAYTIVSRCGADMEQWKEELDFGSISEFNTTKTLSVLGSTTTEMCKPLLMEIGRTIGACDRQAARKRAEEKAAGERMEVPEKNMEIRQSENFR